MEYNNFTPWVRNRSVQNPRSVRVRAVDAPARMESEFVLRVSLSNNSQGV